MTPATTPTVRVPDAMPSLRTATVFNTAPSSKHRFGTPGAYPLPPTWNPRSRTVARWAKRLGIPRSQVLSQYLPDFKRTAINRKFLYRNWEAAFANCIRHDWFGVRTKEPAHG